MIRNIMELLQLANGESENIRVAQGKNALPTSLKNGYKLLKNQIRWR